MRTFFSLFGRFQKPTRPAITALSHDLGPNRYGIVVSAYNEPTSMRLVSWEVTTP